MPDRTDPLDTLAEVQRLCNMTDVGYGPLRPLFAGYSQQWEVVRTGEDGFRIYVRKENNGLYLIRDYPEQFLQGRYRLYRLRK